MQQETSIKKQGQQVAPFLKPSQKYTSVVGLRAFMEETYGYGLSKSRIYALTMNDEIPHIKAPGGRLLFPIADIIKWIEGDEKKEVV
jgi:Helix-turn-helix domain